MFSYQAAIAMSAVAKDNSGDGKNAKTGESAAKPLYEWNVHSTTMIIRKPHLTGYIRNGIVESMASELPRYYWEESLPYSFWINQPNRHFILIK